MDSENNLLQWLHGHHPLLFNNNVIINFIISNLNLHFISSNGYVLTRTDCRCGRNKPETTLKVIIAITPLWIAEISVARKWGWLLFLESNSNSKIDLNITGVCVIWWSRIKAANLFQCNLVNMESRVGYHLNKHPFQNLCNLLKLCGWVSFRRKNKLY